MLLQAWFCNSLLCMDFSDFLKSSRTGRWHEIAYWGLLLVACVTFYVMNCLTPFKEDDMLHSLVIGELTHVNHVGDLLRSYWNKYFILNGRSSDMLAELFCGLLGKPVFNICNAVMFGLLAHVISLLATGHRSLLAQVMLYACMGTCYPVPGETLLWLAGSCNYLWTITGTLLVLRFLQRHRDWQLRRWQLLLVMLGAFIAGAGNEAMSFAFMAACAVFYLFHRNQLDRTVVLVLVCYGLGALMILCSPAAWHRAAGGIVVDLPVKELLMSRFYIVGEKMVRYAVPVLAWGIGFGVLLCRGFKVIASSCWTYLLIFTTLLMLALGMMTDRPYAPLATVSLVIVIIAVHVLTRRLWPLRALAIVAAMGLAVLTSARGITVLREYKAFEDKVISEVRSAPLQVVLPESHFATYSRFLYPLHFKSDFYFTNEYIWKAYFDKENLQFVNDSVYHRFHHQRLLDGAVPMPFKGNHPSIAGAAMAVPGQNYMIVPLREDTVPTTYQVGMALWSTSSDNLTEQEREYRRSHAMQSSGNPFGYYPLRYQGKVLLVLPLPENRDSCLVVPMHYRDENEMRLYRTAPNPPEFDNKSPRGANG